MATIPSSRVRKYVHLGKGARCSFKSCNGRKRHASIEWLFKRVQQCESARTKLSLPSHLFIMPAHLILVSRAKQWDVAPSSMRMHDAWVVTRGCSTSINTPRHQSEI